MSIKCLCFPYSTQIFLILVETVGAILYSSWVKGIKLFREICKWMIEEKNTLSMTELIPPYHLGMILYPSACEKHLSGISPPRNTEHCRYTHPLKIWWFKIFVRCYDKQRSYYFNHIIIIFEILKQLLFIKSPPCASHHVNPFLCPIYYTKHWGMQENRGSNTLSKGTDVGRSRTKVHTRGRSPGSAARIKGDKPEIKRVSGTTSLIMF